jgi:hypothetical protein
MTDDLRFPTTDSADARACAAVDERLMDYLEGDLPAGDGLVFEDHLAGCARCRTLVADLRAIAGEAAALPTLRPERDLWDGIARRIEAPVVALPSRTTLEPAAPAVHVTHTDRRAAPGDRATIAVSRRWLAAAAAALVAATAGATNVATHDGPAAVRQVAAGPEAQSGTSVPAVTPAPVPSADSRSIDSTPAAPAPAAPAPAAPATRERPAAPTARLAARRSAPGAPLDAAVPGAVAYDRAIAAMRDAVGERRAELDSGTVEVLERNLRIIDEAIRQSREALARDPKSQFLGRALTSALDRKLELLRTAAMLPRS